VVVDIRAYTAKQGQSTVLGDAMVKRVVIKSQIARVWYLYSGMMEGDKVIKLITRVK